MISSEILQSDNQRPRSLHLSKSFSRPTSSNFDAIPSLCRTSSLQITGIYSSFGEKQKHESDTFERNHYDEEFKIYSEIPRQLPDDYYKLPIELIGLSDHFIESLSAKVHQSPPTIEKLSGLFQDFYKVAIDEINIHVLSLSARLNRQRFTSPSLSSSITSAQNKFKTNSETENSDQQMLTLEEIAGRREARKILELKRMALEEAIERKVCEATYDRIWRHRCTHDEEQDEKLRSRTAALSLVGIGLRDLGVDLGVENSEDSNTIQKKESEVAEWLSEARKELCAMNNLKYPLGKLQHLKKAHKAIVETLSHFHPSSSADEIMPMLIYTLITSRPEGINIISNLYFIQRFRNENKIDGEAAYCLTNLEAAISYLETVDLASLRADEVLSGPPKTTSRTNTPSPEIFDPLINPLTPSTSVSAIESTCASPSSEITKEEPPSTRDRVEPQYQSHRLSGLFQAPSSLGVASDAVLSSADQGLESLGNSIGDSYKFILGKLKGRIDDVPETKLETSKTLEDLQKLSAHPPEDTTSNSGASSIRNLGTSNRIRADSGSRIDERILSMIGGRKSSRDKSVDSNKRVSFAEENESGKIASTLQSLPSPNPALVESMRNLGNTLNPMNRISGMGMIRAFGRSTPPSSIKIPSTSSTTINDALDSAIANIASSTPDLTKAPPSKDSIRISPPITKFLELQSAGDMKLNEVKELLRDYKRLASAMKDLGIV
ncbi:Vacuolar protein sorting-associated protein 9b [Erysiphe necator]|nr:Vacuolar protein sorting-associated protein 9b [Erysiphe necator]